MICIPPQLPRLRHTNPMGQSPSLPAEFPFPSDPGVAEKIKYIFIVSSAYHVYITCSKINMNINEWTYCMVDIYCSFRYLLYSNCKFA